MIPTRKVWTLHMAGHTDVAISRYLGITVDEVIDAIDRAREVVARRRVWK